MLCTITIAENFENVEDWSVENIVVRGQWTNYVDLHNATALHWYIYADNAEPAGFPGDGMNLELLTPN